MATTIPMEAAPFLGNSNTLEDDPDIEAPLVAWATPGLRELNPDAFESYSELKVKRIMQENAARIEEEQFAAEWKCATPKVTKNPRYVGFEGTAKEVKDARARAMNESSKRFVASIVIGLMLEAAFLVWLAQEPVDALFCLALFSASICMSCVYVYMHAHGWTPEQNELPPHLKNTDLMDAQKLQFLVDQMSAADSGREEAMRSRHTKSMLPNGCDFI